MAALAVMRLMPRVSAISLSEETRWPGESLPLSIISITICST
jgi:hypothetical protein